MIRDIGKVVGGGTPATGISDYYDGTVPWITPKDLSSGEFKYIYRGERNISESGLENSSAKLLPKGTVLMTSRAPIGYLAIAATNVTTNQGFKSIIPDTNYVLSEFLYYYLKSNIGYIKSLGVGTTFLEVSTRVVENVSISLPDLEYQTKVVQLLKSLDDQILLLKALNDNLDDQMKALFKRMFSPDVVEQHGKLGDFCDVQKGLSYKGSGLSDDEGALLINLGNIVPGGGYRKDKDKFYTGEYKEKNVVKPGDIIIANTDMTYDRIILGSPVLVPDYPGVILFTHHLFAFRDVKLPVSFLYYYLRTDEFHSMCESSANGTTVLAITRDDVLDADIPLPTQSDLSLFDKAASKCLQLMATNEREISRLSALRDNLLPRLMSGEIDVSSLELPTKYSFSGADAVD